MFIKLQEKLSYTQFYRNILHNTKAIAICCFVLPASFSLVPSVQSQFPLVYIRFNYLQVVDVSTNVLIDFRLAIPCTDDPHPHFHRKTKLAEI